MSSESAQPRTLTAAQFEQFAALSLDILTVSDGSGRFLWVNEAFERILGWSLEAATARPYTALVHPDDVAATLAQRDAATRGGSVVDFENRYRHRDGSWRRLSWRCGPITPEGTIIATARDVTERHAQAQTLAESEERWRSIAENPFDVVSLVDRDGTIRFLSQTDPRHTPEQLIDHATLFDFVEPRQHGVVREALACLFERGEPTSYRVYVPALDRWFDNACGPVRRDGVVVLASILSRDATEQHHTEEALANSVTALGAAQEIANVGSLRWTAEGDRFEWSDQLYRITGVARETPLDSALWDALVHPEDLPRVQAARAVIRATGRPEPMSYRIVRPDGAVRHVVTNARALYDTEGRFIGVLGTVLDVTERELLQQQLLVARGQEAIAQLAGGIAHDFNNMLTVVRGCTEELRQGAGTALLDQIDAAAEGAADLTRKLLALSAQALLNAADLDCNALVEESVELIRRITGPEIEVRTALAPEAGVIHADARQLQQALFNLAVNARDAMPGGGVLTLATASAVGPGGDLAELTVQDTGAGMDPAVRERVFEPFFTTKPTGRGTGLGLASVRGTVAQHGGTIEVESAPGHGTTFRLRFPRVARAPAARPHAEPAPPPPAGQGTILLVEDDAQIAGLCRRALERVGYRVLTALAPGEARARWRAERPAIRLVISDVSMPECTGPELVADLRRDVPTLPAVFISGHAPERAGVAERAAADRMLPKPFAPRELLAAVAAMLPA